MKEAQEIQKRTEGPIGKVREYLANPDVKGRLLDILGKRAAAFSNSIINVVSGSKQLQDIARDNPGSIMRAAMKAATVNLPIDPALGWAAIVPYGKEACFQIMYKGVIQLCIRSRQYKTINCSEIYADELKSNNPITGEVTFNDPETYKMRYQDNRDKHVVGHYIYFRLKTGFEKSGYISCKEALAHAKKYSKAYQYDLKFKKATSAWSTNYVEMGNKTVILKELKRYGVMSIDMQDALIAEHETFEEAQTNASRMIAEESGSEPVDTTFEENDKPDPDDKPDAETQAKIDKEKAKLAAADKKAKTKGKDKDAKPKYHCNNSKCKIDFQEPNATNVVKGSQCPNCLTWNTQLNNPEAKTDENIPDPSIMEDEE